MATPNMGLVLPSVGVTIGPAWASQLNTALEDVDAHDHSPGSGVAITPSGLSINATLPFNGNAAGTVGRVELVSQAATTVLPCNVYVVAGDLWYTNASGTAVQLTIGGTPAGGGGSISGMTGTTASAVFNNGTKAFEWNQASGLRATLDALAVQLRQAGGSTAAAVTLVAPTSGVTSYSLTLPATAPATVGRFLFAATTGVASWVQPDASTVEVSGTTLQVKAMGVGTSQLADLGVTTAKLAALSVTAAKIAVGAVGTSQIFPGAVTGGISGTSPLGSIAYQTIVTENLADGLIIEAKLGAGSVTSTKIGANAVILGKIASGAVDNAALVTNAVTTVKITDLNVTTAKLADLGVTTAKLADLNVTTGKIADLAVTTGKLAALAVTGAKIASETITADKYISSFSTYSFTGSAFMNATSLTTIYTITGFSTYKANMRIRIQPNPDTSPAEFFADNNNGTNETVYMQIDVTGATTKSFKYRFDLNPNSFTQIPMPNVELYVAAGTVDVRVKMNVSSTGATMYYAYTQLYIEQGD